jgi:hypothetical protein
MGFIKPMSSAAHTWKHDRYSRLDARRKKSRPSSAAILEKVACVMLAQQMLSDVKGNSVSFKRVGLSSDSIMNFGVVSGEFPNME